MSTRITLFLAVGLYTISLLLPGIIYNGDQEMYGYYILAFGWFAVVHGVLAWFANPLFLLALVRMRVEKPKTMFITALVAFVLGLTAFMLRSIPNLDKKGPDVDHLAIGYYIWMASIVLLAIYAYRKMAEEKNILSTEEQKMGPSQDGQASSSMDDSGK